MGKVLKFSGNNIDRLEVERSFHNKMQAGKNI